MTIYPENESTQSSAAEIWTVQRVLSWSAGWLKEKSRDSTGNHRLEAELLLASVLELERMKLYLQLDRPLSKAERDTFKVLLRRRVEGEPIAYILGYRDFYRHRFKVSPAVLIPRPDTELLVETALNEAKRLTAPKILDVGTGSGCVAISLATEIPEALVEAWDISDEALQVAAINKDVIGVPNLTIVKKDALHALAFEGEAYDLIVSNPPYIAADESSIMSPETLKYEPRGALFPEGADGLTFYRSFAANCLRALRPQGKIFLEIGMNQGEKVAQLFNDAGWRKISVVRDLAGHDRVVSAERD